MVGKAIRRISRIGYKHVVKPVLFMQSPDIVHEKMIRSAHVLHTLRGTRILRVWQYQNPRLAQTLFDMPFKNPLGLSAGLDKNFDLPSIVKHIGMGFEIGGSVTAAVCVGNPRPWFHRLPKEKSLVVHVGLANNGVVRNIKQIMGYDKKLWHDFPLSVSVAKTNSPQNVSDEVAIDDYCDSLRKLEEARCAPLYEVNISCPNTYGGEPFTTPERLEQLLSAIDRLSLTRPIFLKMPTDKTTNDFENLVEVASRHTVAGLTIGNLMKDRSKLKHPELLSDDIQGGLSGLPDQKITTDLISRTYMTYGDRFIIIGVGGIFTAEDAYEKIRAGASLVALVTALMFEGPQVVGEINEGLVALLDRDGFSSITEAVGADHR